MDIITELGQDVLNLKAISEILFALGAEHDHQSENDTENALLFLSNQVFDIAARLESFVKEQ